MSDATMPNEFPHRRPVRSFVLRGGRLTEGQKRALDQLWPKYGLDPAASLVDFATLFGNPNPVVLDIGFGNGESTWQMASDRPDENYLGVEVHRPGVGHLLLRLAEHQLDNVRVACGDAVEFLSTRLPEQSLSGVRLYFPDPWPKKRHSKRRIVQTDFMELLAGKLIPGGILHMATDWGPYADHMLEIVAGCEAFVNLSVDGGFCLRPAWRPITKYETRGQKLGHDVYDLICRRKS